MMKSHQWCIEMNTTIKLIRKTAAVYLSIFILICGVLSAGTSWSAQSESADSSVSSGFYVPQKEARLNALNRYLELIRQSKDQAYSLSSVKLTAPERVIFSLLGGLDTTTNQDVHPQSSLNFNMSSYHIQDIFLNIEDAPLPAETNNSVFIMLRALSESVPILAFTPQTILLIYKDSYLSASTLDFHLELLLPLFKPPASLSYEAYGVNDNVSGARPKLAQIFPAPKEFNYELTSALFDELESGTEAPKKMLDAQSRGRVVELGIAKDGSIIKGDTLYYHLHRLMAAVQKERLLKSDAPPALVIANYMVSNPSFNFLQFLEILKAQLPPEWDAQHNQELRAALQYMKGAPAPFNPHQLTPAQIARSMSHNVVFLSIDSLNLREKTRQNYKYLEGLENQYFDVTVRWNHSQRGFAKRSDEESLWGKIVDPAQQCQNFLADHKF